MAHILKIFFARDFFYPKYDGFKISALISSYKPKKTQKNDWLRDVKHSDWRKTSREKILDNIFSQLFSNLKVSTKNYGVKSKMILNKKLVVSWSDFSLPRKSLKVIQKPRWTNFQSAFYTLNQEFCCQFHLIKSMFPTIKCQNFVMIFDNCVDSKSIIIL